MMNKNISLVLIGLALVVGLVAGHSFWGKVAAPVAGGPSPVGTLRSNAKDYTVTFIPATGTATTTSILNSDSTDRYVTNDYIFCTGVGTSKTAYTGTGLASLTFTAATTSTANPTSLTNTNYILNSSVATSSTVTFVATSTEGVIAGWSRIWPTGTYLTFSSNATNTAICTVGVHTIGS